MEKRKLITSKCLFCFFEREYFQFKHQGETFKYPTYKDALKKMESLNVTSKILKVSDVAIKDKIVTIESKLLFPSQDYVLLNITLKEDDSTHRIISKRGNNVFSILKEHNLNINQIKTLSIQ